MTEPAFAALWRKERGQYAIKPQHHRLPRKTDEGAFVKGTFRCVPTAFGFAAGIAILLAAAPALAEIAFTGVAPGMRAAQCFMRPLTYLLIDIIGYIVAQILPTCRARQAAIR